MRCEATTLKNRRCQNTARVYAINFRKQIIHICRTHTTVMKYYDTCEDAQLELLRRQL